MKYLFTYFTGEHEEGEQVYFALSSGLNWKDLNNGKAIVNSDIGEVSVRDTFIVKYDESGEFTFLDDKIYIYPTTDGHVDWSGHNFSVFSSNDGINFIDQGIIVDVKSEQVEWATGSALAPCMVQ